MDFIWYLNWENESVAFSTKKQAIEYVTKRSEDADWGLQWDESLEDYISFISTWYDGGEETYVIKAVPFNPDPES